MWARFPAPGCAGALDLFVGRNGLWGKFVRMFAHEARSGAAQAGEVSAACSHDGRHPFILTERRRDTAGACEDGGDRKA
jgi:hypothetical protein